MTDVPVTAEQFGQLEVAWFLCSFGNGRRCSGESARWWDESLRHILGFVPEGDFRPVVTLRHSENCLQEKR